MATRKIITFSGRGPIGQQQKLTKCVNCSISFKIGEKILTKKGGSHGVRRYCIVCAKLLNLL